MNRQDDDPLRLMRLSSWAPPLTCKECHHAVRGDSYTVDGVCVDCLKQEKVRRQYGCIWSDEQGRPL